MPHSTPSAGVRGGSGANALGAAAGDADAFAHAEGGALVAGCCSAPERMAAAPMPAPTPLSLASVLDATGAALLELSSDCVVLNCLCSRPFGHRSVDLINRSLLNIVPTAEHQPMLQTVQALVAMAASFKTVGSASAPPISTSSPAVRMLHHAACKEDDGQTRTLVIDSMVTMILRHGAATNRVLISSRTFLGALSEQDLHVFRVFPVREARPVNTAQPQHPNQQHPNQQHPHVPPQQQQVQRWP